MKKSILGLLMIMLLIPVFSFASTTTPSTVISEQSHVDQRQELMLQLISLLRTYIAQLQQQLALKGVSVSPVVLGIATSTISTTEQAVTPNKRRGGGGGGGSRNVQETLPVTDTGTTTSTTTEPSSLRVELETDYYSPDEIYDFRNSKGVYFDFYMQPFGANVVPQTIVFTVETPGATTTDIIDRVIFEGNRGTLLMSNNYDEATYSFDTQNLIGILDNQRQRLGVSVSFEDLSRSHINQTVRIKADEEEKTYWKILSNGLLISTSTITGNLVSGTYLLSYSPLIEDLRWRSDYIGVFTDDERLVFTMDSNIAATWDDFNVPITPTCIKFVNFCTSTSTEFSVLGHSFLLMGPDNFTATTTINWKSRRVDINNPSTNFSVNEDKFIDSEFTFTVKPSIPGEYTMTFLSAEIESEDGSPIEVVVIVDEEEDMSTSIFYLRP